MTITDFIRSTDLNHGMLLGYYGGGNYGDELLLEVLQNLFALQSVTHVTIGYQRPEKFLQMHHDFGYQPFSIRNKILLLKHTLASRHVIIGGGGLWGVDMNFNTFLMSVYLWICRRLLAKNVYLLGVGYYNSTSRLGRIGAWFAGKSATQIIARDGETYNNFSRIAPGATSLDKDIAWYIPKIPLAVYQRAAKQLGKEIAIQGQTLFMALRRPQSKRQRKAFLRFAGTIKRTLEANQGKQTIIARLELGEVDPGSLRTLESIQQRFAHVHILDAAINPLTLYALFHEYRDKLMLIAPQFHILLTAHLNGVPFLPISYDNKVKELLSHIGIEPAKQIALEEVTEEAIQQFIDAQLK